eukprot:GFYU01008836.1.p1 GENE.GFYU01008836.1~~GFYU01008836.1.p1  ORF type:complete len:724 (+),score=269.99 GFYU01008836.1:307-2172(+)
MFHFRSAALQVEKSMLVALTATLEGHNDRKIYEHISDVLNATQLVKILNSHWQVSRVRWTEDEDMVTTNDGETATVSQSHLDLTFDYYTLLKSIVDGQESIDIERTSSLFKSWGIAVDNWEGKKANRDVTRRLGRIEIMRHERLERVYFVIPRFCLDQYRKPAVEDWKAQFLDDVPRTTPNAKIQYFFEQWTDLIRVMMHEHHMEEDLKKGIVPVLKYLFATASSYENRLMYLLAFVANIILILYYEVENSVDSPITVDPTARLALTLLGVAITLLAMLSTIGYLISWGPIYVERGESRRKIEAELEAKKKKKKKYTFRWPNFVLSIGRNIRAVGDFLIHPEVAFKLLLIAVSAAGVFYPFAFAFHLFAAVQNIGMVRAVQQAVTGNYQSLGATLLLAFMIIYVYTLVGFQFYRGHYEFGDGPAFCHHLLQCVATHLDYGFRGAPTWIDMEEMELTVGQWVMDVTYNLVVILIMVAIVSGIIIDSFGAKRDERLEREDETLNKCFICNIERETFDRYITNGFQEHVKEDHNMWSYVFWMYTISTKKEDDHTGQEAYVAEEMASKSTAFFPNLKAKVLEGHLEEEELAAIKKSVENLDFKLGRSMNALQDYIADLQRQISKQ